VAKNDRSAGSAHDRAKKRARQKTVQAKEPGGTDLSPPEISPLERTWQFLDSGWVHTVAGVMGAFPGTFLDGRYYAVLSLYIWFGLQRSKSLDGIGKAPARLIKGAVVILSAVLLFVVGILINKRRPQTYVPTDYKNAAQANLPLPITQQVTNIYNSYISPAKPVGEPRIDLSEFLYDEGADEHELHFHNTATNNGEVPALDVRGSVQSSVRRRSKESEDELFAKIRTQASDKVQPESDQPPGEKYQKSEPITVSLSRQDARADAS
jgi:hypothetical protein